MGLCQRPITKIFHKEQLQRLRRNLGYIESLLEVIPGRAVPLSWKLLRNCWVIQHVYRQQETMCRTKKKSCDDLIVSIHQPHVRPIVRAKANKKAEFGAKFGVSLTGEGIVCVDKISWEAYHEGNDLKAQLKSYKKRCRYYPAVVLADTIYGPRENLNYLKESGMRFAGKLIGRSKKETKTNRESILKEKKRRREEYRQRIPIEGKFGQGKNGYRLNYIRAKTAKTSESWIRSIFLVMNLLVPAKSFFVFNKKVFCESVRRCLAAIKKLISCRVDLRSFPAPEMMLN